MSSDIGNPVFTHGLTDYVFHWPELGVRVNVDRMEEEGTGEISVYYINGTTKLLHLSRLNLLSSTSISSLAKRLNENLSVDWSTILTHVTSKTIETMRQGEPAVPIGMKPTKMATDWLLYPLLERGEPTTVYAPGGSGKSYVASLVASLCQFNVSALDWFPDCQTNSLYLDWESTREKHERRVWAIKQGLEVTDERQTFLYRHCERPLIDDVYAIQKIVSDNKIGLVIVDSQMAASGNSLDQAQNATQFYNALRSLHCTTLTIDHQNKAVIQGMADSTIGPYGSVVKWNRSRSQFELKTAQEPGDSFMDMSLSQRKNNDGPLLKPIGIRVNFISANGVLDKVVFDKLDLTESSSLSQTLTQKDRLIALLRGGKQKAEYLTEQLGLNPNDKSVVHKVESAMFKYKDIFRKFPDGWGLLSHDD